MKTHKCSRKGCEEQCPTKVKYHSDECLQQVMDARKAARASKRAAKEPRESFVVKGDTALLTRVVGERVQTLEDLVRVCKIDTEKWTVSEFECGKWDMGAVLRRDYGEDQITVTEMFRVTAKLKSIAPQVELFKNLSNGLLEDIRKEVNRGKPVRAPRKFVDSNWLFEFAPFDLHAGKYTWDEETVTNYDTDISSDLFNASFDYLLGRALKLTDGKLSRILCVVGNDVSHIDSKRGDTTQGTRLDVDTRFIRVFRRICAIHRRVIDLGLDVAPVDVVVVPGNHDELTSFHLGEVLKTRYEGHKHVTVNNSARLTKYYDFGTNLFGFTHGDAERVNELGLRMAREVPDLWARCASREWHIGHKHISEKWELQQRVKLEQDLFSDKGVRIRRLTSLSAHDAWHTKHAYMDRRACEGFVFHRDAGFSEHLSFNVDHFSGKALSK